MPTQRSDTGTKRPFHAVYDEDGSYDTVPLPANEEMSIAAKMTTATWPTPRLSHVWTPGEVQSSEYHFQSPLDSWTPSIDDFTHHPSYLASEEELRSMLFTVAQSAAPTRAGSPVQADAEETLLQTGSSRPANGSSSVSISSRVRIDYLKNYVSEVAPWLDMFDSKCVFSIQLPALSRDSPALFYAILAISARQMERKRGSQEAFDSLQLYQEAIRLLSPLLEVRDPKVVAACVLLCGLEMMSARAQDWRRHLEGCAALFGAFTINGFSEGLLQSLFWCYARMDVCGAIISDGTQCTLLKPQNWLSPGSKHSDARRLFHDTNSPDMYANYMVYLSAKACELVSDRTKCAELGEENGCTGDVFHARWLQLWEDLQNWLSERPDELLPVFTSAIKPFPHIFFVHWAAISSNQLYHTSCIILLDIKPKSINLFESSEKSTLWHARRVCGISLANPHQGCLNNAIQPLWIAGRLFSHRSEHEIITNLIRRIETTTGWGACWRIRDLEAAWGYTSRQNEDIEDPRRIFTAP